MQKIDLSKFIKIFVKNKPKIEQKYAVYYKKISQNIEQEYRNYKIKINQIIEEAENDLQELEYILEKLNNV